MGWLLFLLAGVVIVVVYARLRSERARAAAAEMAMKNRMTQMAEAVQRTEAELRRQLAQAAESANTTESELRARIAALTLDNEGLAAFRDVRDVAIEAQRIRAEAEAALAKASSAADALRFAAQAEANAVRNEALTAVEALRRDSRTANAEARAKAERLEREANIRAARIVSDAEARAQEIAGDAYEAMQDADRLERAAVAMRNVIEGYGDRYLKPTYSLLDELAEEFGFDEAGRELKSARALSTSLVTSGRAATCDYVEANRRDTAIRFVLDAFNGKVETILARVKGDNAGTLEQQIRDAYALVNHNGRAFRSAQITTDYLAARLEELKWAASVVALKEREREEQRRIREQIREEERARKEIERALRDAAREEDALQKAMAKVQAQVAKANDEQRAAFQAQLAELEVRLAEAEARNQRALSMAQQTKAGHVYVISNTGSFGETVLKVGMTRRLEPLDRVRELGDASVPFPFDVHAMIWSDDAPALENALHKQFVTAQVNKVNPRKEFFRVPIADLRRAVEAMGLQASWTLSAEASQYRETLAIERALAENTAVAQQWLRNQMSVAPGDPVAESVEE